MFVAGFFAGVIFYFLLSEQRSSYGEHRWPSRAERFSVTLSQNRT